MKKKDKKNFPEELNFWQSYSDMMAALLLVFVLLIAFIISAEQRSLEKQKNDLDQLSIELEESQKKYEESQQKFEAATEVMNKQQGKLDDIIGVRAEIVRGLQAEFANSGMALTVDEETGSISFDSTVLFDYNQHTLKPTGKAFLNQFFPMYFEVILNNQFKDYVAEVIIEGHTDDAGSYLYNLDLSQKRAFSVAQYCLGEHNNMFSVEKLEEIRELVTANGRAYYGLIRDDQGNVDAEASRRVEVKFRLSEEDMIREMSEILNEKTE